VHFSPLTAMPPLLQFSIKGPRDTSPTVSLDDAADPDAFTVTRGGRYTLLVANPSATSSDFSFQIHLVPLREVFGIARG
jgi:hypothetical protein